MVWQRALSTAIALLALMSIGGFAWTIFDLLPDWWLGVGEPKLSPSQAKAKYFEKFLLFLIFLPFLSTWFGGAVLMACSLLPSLHSHQKTIAMTGAAVACTGILPLWFLVGPGIAITYGAAHICLSIWILTALSARE